MIDRSKSIYKGVFAKNRKCVLEATRLVVMDDMEQVGISDA